MPTFDQAYRRHALHYASVLIELNREYMRGGSASDHALQRYELDRDNIERGEVWSRRLSGRDPAAEVATLQYAVGGADIRQLRQSFGDRLTSSQAALEIAARRGERSVEAYLRSNIGFLYFEIGNYQTALQYLEQGLALSRELGDTERQAKTIAHIGAVYAAVNPRLALKYLEESLRHFRQAGDRRGEGSTLGEIGNAWFKLKKYRQALSYFKQNLTIANEVGDQRGAALSMGNLGAACGALGRRREAMEYLQKQMTLALEIGDRVSEGQALSSIGRLYADSKRFEKATEYYARCLQVVLQTGDCELQALTLGNWALAVDKMKDRTQAIALMERALEIYSAMGSPSAAQVRATLNWWYTTRARKGWWSRWL